MKTIFKIVIGIVVAVVILVIAIVALIGGAANQVQKDNDKTAITPTQFQSVKKGTSMQEVIAQLGKPNDKQVTSMKGMKNQTCIYYNKKGEIASSYQFCFDGKSLQSKSSY